MSDGVKGRSRRGPRADPMSVFAALAVHGLWVPASNLQQTPKWTR